jgi:hypothetical protein
VKIEAGKYYKTRDGRKVGPMKYCVDYNDHPWEEDFNKSTHIWRDDGTSGFLGDPDLIAEWPTKTGPVRTVTRKEIVLGVYGRVGIDRVSDGYASMYFGGDSMLDAAELRAAAATLIEIADALDEE